MQGTAEWNPAPDHVKATCMAAAKYGEEQGVPLPKLALKYSIQSAAEGDIDVTLVGMSSPEEVCTHMAPHNQCICTVT